MSVANHLGEDAGHLALRRDVYSGLQKTPKSLPPKWFYDTVGSELFDQITRLPEYYPTRAEAEILRARSAEVASACRADTLVELGSGTSEKTRMLLDALRHRGSLRRFVPFDVDASVLSATATAIQREYSGVEINAVCGDFEEHLTEIPRGGRRLFVFLGSTIGNLTPGPRAQFLTALAGVMRPGDSLLLGTDLVKDAARLVRAYDDPGGVTAQFNRNVLAVINRELEADFDVDAFQHVARWNSAEERIEMWLRADGRQRVRVGALDLTVDFDAGEEMLTEVSCKFRPQAVGAELAAAGLHRIRWWTDEAGDFGPVAGRQVSRAGDDAGRSDEEKRRKQPRRRFAGRPMAGSAPARRGATPGQRGLFAPEFRQIDLVQHARQRPRLAVMSRLRPPPPCSTPACCGRRMSPARRRGGVHHRLAHARICCWAAGLGRTGRWLACPASAWRCRPWLPRASVTNSAGRQGSARRRGLHVGRRPARPSAPDRGGQPPWRRTAAGDGGALCRGGIVRGCRAGPGPRGLCGGCRPYASSRKWIAGPRGVGVLAVRPELMERLRARLPAPDWMPPLTVAQQLGFGEANVAARVGFSVALGEHLACGPQAIRARLAELGDIARTVLADVSGWRVVEAVDEPSAITTLAPIDGADPAAVRVWFPERRIVTTYAGVERAPLELPAPVLRISPHVDNTADDLDAFAEALVAATAATSGER
ncbi:hypothetical protein J113_25830 [Mycobacterium tuberculosis CAS/NITR204]|uniref:Histidine N-alpha-methyltransferase n=2 Tax=Bacillati TaxID=1783272 RepID=R4MNW0_MYCTX|nr:hypothetical protein J113_25830 [Mycobacterium tuberculosis CAS/NITR204]